MNRAGRAIVGILLLASAAIWLKHRDSSWSPSSSTPDSPRPGAPSQSPGASSVFDGERVPRPAAVERLAQDSAADRLEGTQPRRCQVFDPQGRPIGGALAIGTSGERFSEPTGADGMARLDVQDAGPWVRFIAPEFAAKTVDLGSLSGDPVPIILTPCTRLQVRVVGPTGTPQSRWPLLLSADASVLPEADWDPAAHCWRDADLLGERPPSTRPRGGSVSVRATEVLFQSDASGMVQIRRIQPGVWFRLSVTDDVGTVGADRSLRLAAGETRVEELRLKVEPRSLTGAVIDAHGVLVPDATVNVFTERGDGRGFSVDNNGRFELRGLLVERLRLRIEAPDGGLLLLPSLEIPPSGLERSFVLAPTHRLVVRVFYESGERLPAEAGSFLLAASSATDDRALAEWVADPDASGDWVFDAVPDAPLRMHAILRGHLYASLHEGFATATMIVPNPARIVVQWPFPLRADAEHVLTVDYLDHDERSITGPTQARASWPIERSASRQTLDLQPGRYRLQIHAIEAGAQQGTPVSKPCDVRLESHAELTLRLEPWRLP